MRYILINSARTPSSISLSLSLLPIHFPQATIFFNLIMRQNTLLYIISCIVTLHKHSYKIHLFLPYASSMISLSPGKPNPLSFCLFFPEYPHFRSQTFSQMGNRLKAYHIKKRQTIELRILIVGLQQRHHIPNFQCI